MKNTILPKVFRLLTAWVLLIACGKDAATPPEKTDLPAQTHVIAAKKEDTLSTRILSTCATEYGRVRTEFILEGVQRTDTVNVLLVEGKPSAIDTIDFARVMARNGGLHTSELSRQGKGCSKKSAIVITVNRRPVTGQRTNCKPCQTSKSESENDPD